MEGSMRNLLNKGLFIRMISTFEISHGAWFSKIPHYFLEMDYTKTKGCSSSNNYLLQLQDLLYNIWVLLN
jgi:hypothetical protein